MTMHNDPEGDTADEVNLTELTQLEEPIGPRCSECGESLVDGECPDPWCEENPDNVLDEDDGDLSEDDRADTD